MVKAFKRDAAKIEVRSHAARFGAGLEHSHVMAGARGMVCRGQAHCSRPDHRHAH